MTNTETDLITAAEATSALGFKNRSSLTRLVQRGDITPKFVASGKTGEQFFDRSDVARLKADRAARMNASEAAPGTTDPAMNTVALIFGLPTAALAVCLIALAGVLMAKWIRDRRPAPLRGRVTLERVMAEELEGDR